MPLLYPVLAQVLLTLLVVMRLGSLRVSAHRARAVRFREVALSDAAYPEEARKLGNNLRNQFETPVIFYVLCGAAIYIGATGFFMTLLAWLYVVTRVVHCLIHITHNRVQQRFIPFLFGFIILVLMWIVVVARLVTA